MNFLDSEGLTRNSAHLGQCYHNQVSNSLRLKKTDSPPPSLLILLWPFLPFNRPHFSSRQGERNESKTCILFFCFHPEVKNGIRIYDIYSYNLKHLCTRTLCKPQQQQSGRRTRRRRPRGRFIAQVQKSENNSISFLAKSRASAPCPERSSSQSPL